ncbi:hypothetical protein [Desertivirga brevis]|uniref:hypothetical protein n=1 Tax=Desertivirga brevis TaxID=2810310 RepID=UPI001A979723|nr:hypothetical protein [Pedobacter sp. SYSU D00873]
MKVKFAAVDLWHKDALQTIEKYFLIRNSKILKPLLNNAELPIEALSLSNFASILTEKPLRRTVRGSYSDISIIKKSAPIP